MIFPISDRRKHISASGRTCGAICDLDESIPSATAWTAKEIVFDRETAIRLQLHADEARSLRQMAESKGLAESELVREWVLEKLQAR